MTKDNRVGSGTYDDAKAYLKGALEHLIATGRNARDFTEVAWERFGNDFRPYVRQFVRDVREGQVKIAGLSKAAQETIFGRHVAAQEREAMIREAAYLRAERRSFGGSADEDWYAAEQEIDAWLASEAGLVEKGRKALSSVTAVVGKDIEEIGSAIAGWLEDKSGGARPAARRPAVKSPPGTAKKATRRPAAQGANDGF